MSLLETTAEIVGNRHVLPVCWQGYKVVFNPFVNYLAGFFIFLMQVQYMLTLTVMRITVYTIFLNGL